MDFQHIFESFKQFSLSLSLVMCYPLFFLLLLATSLLSTSGADSHDKYNSSCPEHVCGGVSIKYPFWLQDDAGSNRHCGYRNFGLNCSADNQAIFQILEEAYHVKEIDYGNFTLTLVDDDAKTNTTCPRARQNLTLHNVPHLQYTNSDTNLSFYYNCSSAPEGEPSIRCLRFGAMRSFVFLEGGELAGFDWLGSCEEKVVVTVMEREIRRDDLVAGFSGAMIEGFVIKWNHVEECGTCEASDGLCGYDEADQNSNEFLCFCPGGAVNARECKGDGLNWRLKILIGLASAGFSIALMSVAFYIYHQKHKKYYIPSSLGSREISSHPHSMNDLEKDGSYMGVHLFSYGELEDATNNFDPKQELGDGGFGTVYRGKLKDGRVVAVKRLYENNYKRVEQFMNEVDLLTRLRHQNLVTLYGCTSRHCRELLLVYEFIPNGTLADHLHGELAKPGSLTWTQRMNIAIETASALAYLHASDVIHRDVKSTNILLDKNFSVKVADFGLSRLFPNHVTHVSTAPQGTPGYVDPEYHECYQLTDRSDVYSFGVVLAELISSKPAVDISRHRHEINLSNMAMNKIQSRLLHELIDPCLGFDSDPKVRKMITKVAELAFQCLQGAKDMRPSMEEAVKALRDIHGGDYDGKKEKDDKAARGDDDAVLLKGETFNLSPDSVTTNWISNVTTPSASQ